MIKTMIIIALVVITLANGGKVFKRVFRRVPIPHNQIHHRR